MPPPQPSVKGRPLRMASRPARRTSISTDHYLDEIYSAVSGASRLTKIPFSAGSGMQAIEEVSSDPELPGAISLAAPTP
jgi:hypothetical protein